MSVPTWPQRLAGLAPGLVDVHTHAIDPELPELAPGLPSVQRTGPTSARIMLRGAVYRQIDDRSWSVPARLRDMDAEGVAVQVVSPIPVTLCHDADPADATALASRQNDFLADLVARAPDRFLALGAVPLPDPGRAAAELRRCVVELGFAGVEIGTVAGATELADPALAPFLRAASDLGAVVFVHPVDQTLDPRLVRLGLGFGLGMPCETATAAAALLVHGALEHAPGAQVLLAHGGGALPAVLARLARGQLVTDPATPPQALATARAAALWSDSLTYDRPSLDLALNRFGAQHVVVGTDYPFAAREVPAGAVLHGADAGLRDDVHHRNAHSLFATVGASCTDPARETVHP